MSLSVLSRLRPHSITRSLFLVSQGAKYDFHKNKYSHNSGGKQTGRSRNSWVVCGGLVAGTALGFSVTQGKELRAEAENIVAIAGKRVEGLPEYTIEEIGKHDSLENRVWVTYKNGVYDITEFIPMHPGADKLMMAAGGSVEPFWRIYSVHLDNKVIYGMLESYRIGNLKEEDAASLRESLKDSDDPFANAPKRHPALLVNQAKPFNAETPLSIITDSFLTPADLFFVRSHLPIPDIKPEEYELEVGGVGCKDITLSLEDLKKLPKHTIVSGLQCGGNRRLEMKTRKNLKGLDWRGGAIGNAEWAGARLVDVLEAAGFSEEKSPEARHVIFEGLDMEPDGGHFGASITIEKAADPRQDVLLAYEMNGEPLTRDHGYPVRVLAPGVIGARNVKWLGKIEVSEVESDSHWQKRDYKGFHPGINWDNVEDMWDKSQAIQDMPVTSSIATCKKDPETGDLLLSGYAWSGGGRKILRVDLTPDGGKTWTQAHTLVQDTARHPRHWGWTLWEGRIPGEGVEEVWSKAVDSNYNVQPETFENIWNLRGVLSNAYCRYKVNK